MRTRILPTVGFKVVVLEAPRPKTKEESAAVSETDGTGEIRSDEEMRKELEHQNGFETLWCALDDVINLIYIRACSWRTEYRAVPLFGAHLVSVGADAGGNT